MRVLPVLFLLASVPAARAADVSIEQANHAFSQSAVALSAGDALVMHNDDGTVHNLSVIDEDGDPQDLGLQQPGKTLRIQFANAGRFTVRCALTPGMKMTVNVH
ncbi:cupredoxin domain-containing protein [Rhizosaccharibacter radicis]|uniref:EfeO-type cupredoxin-like domain-containing protein n=1 Tax=Rhizosaccharibacter radicis TaxID=2782605 RepID=A0ABT1VWN6_9PROT|nr:hypothetical protein [Acetobacteraceae bacterium KSS12]